MNFICRIFGHRFLKLTSEPIGGKETGWRMMFFCPRCLDTKTIKLETNS